MQIPSDYLSYVIGAIAALAFARWQGWLKVPFLDGVQALQQQPNTRLPTVAYQYQPDGVTEAATSMQSYSAMIDIPHKITVTPQQGNK